VKFRVPLLALVIAVAVGASASQATVSNVVVSLSESSAFEAVSGTTLFYAPTGSNTGSFSVTVTASTTSSLTGVDFQSIAGMSGGGVTVSAPGPYQTTYGWTSSTSASSAYNVTVHDSDPSSAIATFSVIPDTTGPTGQTVALSGGPTYSTLSVPLVLSPGSDAGAGLAAATAGSVERASATLSAGTCGSFGAWAPVTLVSGADTSVTSGNCYHYQYKSADVVGNLSASWSAPTADAKVNALGPVVTDAAPTEVTAAGDQFWNATTKTVWFRPAATGSFTLNATASDSASGITQVAFPDVSTVAGWSGSTGGIDTSSPYSSPVVYAWTAGAAAPGAQQVVATSGSSATATDKVTISADSAPPTGQGVSLTGGPWFGTSVPLTLVAGTDAGSGVDTSRTVVERASATLTNGLCGTFGTFAAVTLSSGADTSVAAGNCYRYQVKATDNVGNVAAASIPSADAKIDKTAPTTPSLFFSGFSNTASSGTVVYFRPGGSGSFSVTAASSDPESGVASYLFPAIPGFTAAGTGPHRTYASTSTGLSATGPLSITATNAAGMSSAVASFSLVPDGTPPTLTVRCNGGVCRSRPYAKTVVVSLSAVDATSGVNTIRWTSDGTDPKVDHGNEYVRGIPVQGLTRLKVRAFDKAGNASALLSLTVNSRVNVLNFGAPPAVVLGAKARYLSVRVSSTRRANVRLTMTGTGLKKPSQWFFILDSGTSVVRVKLPAGVKHPGSYRLVWTLRTGTQTRSKTTRVTLRR
jgi:hypothetical protein